MADAPGRAPLEAVRLALSKLIPLFETHNFLVIDGLMRSTETLRARKQGHYEHQEQGLFATLSEIWPDPERRTALRLVAMVSIGAMRLAIEAWIEDSGKRPIVTYLDAAFSALKEVI